MYYFDLLLYTKQHDKDLLEFASGHVKALWDLCSDGHFFFLRRIYVEGKLLS